MNTSLVSKKWFGVALLAVFLSLFSATGLQAKVAVNVTCNLDAADAEIWWAVSESVTPCEALVETELDNLSERGMEWQASQFASQGDAYWDYVLEIENASADETQITVRRPNGRLVIENEAAIAQYEREIDFVSQGDSGFTPIEFASEGDAYWDYILELETSETDH